MQRELIVESSLFCDDEINSNNVFVGGSSKDFRNACWAAIESWSAASNIKSAWFT